MSIGIIYIIGDIGNMDGKGITLDRVIAQVNAYKNASEYHVKIKSRGGSVDIGFDMYHYLKSLEKPVTTIAIGEVASIASVVFMAGTKRIIQPHAHLLIHNPWVDPNGGYEADDLIALGNDLKKTERELVDFYATTTKNTKQAIAPLMRDETIITPKQAVQLGFATSIENDTTPFAYLSIKTKNMTKKKKTLLTQFLDALKDESTLNLIIKTAEGMDLDFYELEDDDTIAIGAKATIEGKDAQDDYLMADGRTFVFESGELIEIQEEKKEEASSFNPEQFKQDIIETVSTIFNAKLAKVEAENQVLHKTIAKREKVFASLKSLATTEVANEQEEDTKPREYNTTTTVNVLSKGLHNRKNK